MSPPVDQVQSDPKLPEAADVVVIGGGIAGVSAAWHLAGKGHSVALIEKGVIAGEQSSRNWGWCRQQNRDERELPLIKYSLELWGRLSEEIGADVSFRRTGLVYTTDKQSDLDEWEEWSNLAREYQVHSRMLTAEEANALTPGCTKKWIGGVHSPTDGRAEPSKAAPALAEAARRRGVTIHQGCAARGLETQGGRVSAVVTEKGTIRTQAVLLAGGAWSSMFCRSLGIDLPQAGARSTAFSTTEAPEVTAGGLSTPGFVIRRRLDGGYTVSIRGRGLVELTPQGLRYARKFWPAFLKRRAGGVKISVGRSFLEGPEALGRWSADKPTPFERIRVFDPAPDTGTVDEALKQLVEAYPALAGIRMKNAWGGWIDFMPDAVPVISPVEKLPGLTLSTGFSGHGFGIGPGAGRLAADLVAGDAPIVDPTPFRYVRLIDGSPLPPGPM
ncbi:Sarcosine oxidase beta subunit [Roseomonas mucosa]|uniref:D-amino-acid oxidase n=1 Tax=Roseomonas mucosa TaxID=207340 RepID=A0A1S8DB25_9PROT|nr:MULTISPECIES: FAD-binding oxidoreductase [Roseomonas]MBS5904111.1 FAD-binding oxidoreductase [Acetobacteraceae bacterium]ATR22100.1 FAD-dependent oxidoreductase [Roseomonas sp. FDAARGOS_362]AWV21112.1 Sarcosine oxidase beta subunit [Roseomonas mucosa]MCG7352019.1 FAD-binding oxidoreductase [Roseomonas mucosa]MCG7355332.1 FAD-binding oxidoreductase [Roseomonas mucosa]